MKLRYGIFTAIMLLCCGCVEVTVSGTTTDNIYNGVDKRVFGQQDYVVEEKHNPSHKREITSPGCAWTWKNSWHIIKRQPGFLSNDKVDYAYTLSQSNAVDTYEDMTWAHYLYFPYRGQLAERYDQINFMEKEIERVQGHTGYVVRIDKLEDGFYVATYVRTPSSYDGFYLSRVSSYPDFKLNGKTGFGDRAIFFNAKIKERDHRGREFLTKRAMRMNIKDVVLINPKFMDDPHQLTDILVPYKFFANNFIYEHSGIRSYSRDQEPMVVRISKVGVIFRYSVQNTIGEL